MLDIKTLKKVATAYSFAPGSIQDGQGFYTDVIFYDDTQGGAKAKAVVYASENGALDENGEELTFLSVRVVRSPDSDKYVTNEAGTVWTKNQIDRHNARIVSDQNFDKIAADNPGAFAHIKKNGMYYRPGSCGYTERRLDAGIYPVLEAIQEAKGCDLRDFFYIEIIDPEKHNLEIERKVAELNLRRILKPAPDVVVDVSVNASPLTVDRSLIHGDEPSFPNTELQKEDLPTSLVVAFVLLGSFVLFIVALFAQSHC